VNERLGRSDPQMDRLFGRYERRNSIAITDRPEGTRLMIVSDHQIPFVDEAFLKAQLAFADTYRPHDLIYNGDTADMYEISEFDKNPTRQFGIKQELEQTESMLYDFGKRLAKGGRQYFIDGNHEARYRRYLARHASAIADIVPDLDTLLHLDQHCAGSVPYGKAIDYLGFTITHGNFVSQYSAYTAKRHADRYQSSGCNGHTHRCGSYSWRDGRGRSHTWYEIGCACRLDMDWVRGVANWQHGFLCGEVRNGALHPQLVRVIETRQGRGFFAGGEYFAIG
jgi:hypothetical protein